MRLVLVLLVGCTEYKLSGSEVELPADDPLDIPEETTPEETVPEELDPYVDLWDLDEVGGVDVLFFGDTSGSMSVELTSLGSEVTTFVDRLASYTTNWQLLAVTGPTGCGVNGVLRPESTDYASQFAAGIITPPGADEVDEWGLNNVAEAVEQTDKGECNDGFLREDARLHVIFISDEDDNSPGWNTTKKAYWQSYTDAIVEKKGSAEQVVFSGIVGPTPNGCYDAEPGWGYVDAIDSTGGQMLSICTMWEDDIDLLVDASILYSRFELTEFPIPETIVVTVNEEQRKDGWTYEAISNTVEFQDNIPVLGDEVEINYDIDDASDWNE